MQSDEFPGMLVSAAFTEQIDVVLQCRFSDFSVLFSDGVRTAVFLPGAVCPDNSHTALSDCIDCGYSIYTNGKNIIADIRALGNENFRAYLTENKYERLVIPFAECAEASEYGHRQEFLWAREYKAEISRFCQIVLIFTQSFDGVQDCFGLYSDGEAVFAGKRELPDIKIYECSSGVSKFYCAANELEKLAFGNHAVFFNSRNEAAEFASFLQKRKTEYVYIDGTVTSTEIKERLARFSSGEVRALIATKSGISLLPFVDADKAILCGVPFSVSHIGRIAAACRKDSVKIIFSPSDVARNKKILEYFRDTDGDEELYHKRVKKLSEVSEIIINEQVKE